MKKKPELTLHADTLMRISYLVGVFKALNVLYSEMLGDAWVQRPNTNRIFGGQTQVVRRLVDARRGGM